MSRYILKNCPAYIINGHCALNGEWDSPFDEVPCQDRTDCPIKQVAEICQEKWNKFYDPLAKVILQTLQVEEVE